MAIIIKNKMKIDIQTIREKTLLTKQFCSCSKTIFASFFLEKQQSWNQFLYSRPSTVPLQQMSYGTVEQKITALVELDIVKEIQ